MAGMAFDVQVGPTQESCRTVVVDSHVLACLSHCGTFFESASDGATGGLESSSSFQLCEDKRRTMNGAHPLLKQQHVL
jgi:hypothetical protein